MTSRIALHAHTNRGSNDASLTPWDLVNEYARAGFDAVALTDHDRMTDPPGVPGMVEIPGIEHTVDAQRHLHVVEIPSLDFSFLAHPRLPFRDDVRQAAIEYAHDEGLDGVEVANGVDWQYEGVIDGLHELATDDAHNTYQIGQAWVETERRVGSVADVRDVLHSGDYDIAFDPAHASAAVGQVLKGTQVVSNELRRALMGSRAAPDRGTPLYSLRYRPPPGERSGRAALREPPRRRGRRG